MSTVRLEFSEPVFVVHFLARGSEAVDAQVHNVTEDGTEIITPNRTLSTQREKWFAASPCVRYSINLKAAIHSTLISSQLQLVEDIC